jgi:uncharacterized tellurite resistance protein B-like protein
MPIIATIISGLLFWTLYWFIQMGGIEHFRQKKARREEEAARQKGREAARAMPFRAVEDPRDAAAILMLLIAREQGDPTREQIALIEAKLRTVFGFEHDLAERMIQARFIARQADGFDQAARVFADLLRRRLSADERAELIDMLEEVARHEGPSASQNEALTAFKPLIGLASAPG